MTFSPQSPRVISAPCRVVFAGWESTTTRLQQCGWQLAAQEDPIRDRIVLALRHPGLGLRGFSEPIEDVYWRGTRDMRGIVFYVNQLFQADRVEIRYVPDLRIHDFKAIDAFPMFTHGLEKHEEVGEFDNIFAPVLARTEEIIVDPARVGEYLEAIRKAQLPEQEAIRQRQQQRENYRVAARQVFHAQILSLAA